MFFYPAEFNTYVGGSVPITWQYSGSAWIPEHKITDHIGNLRTIVKNNNVVFKKDYYPFGEEVQKTGEAERVGFIGKEGDSESSLGDFGFRKYEDKIGRFISIDRLWEEQYGWTPYHYAYNNPVEFLDPSGLIPIDDNLEGHPKEKKKTEEEIKEENDRIPTPKQKLKKSQSSTQESSTLVIPLSEALNFVRVNPVAVFVIPLIFLSGDTPVEQPAAGETENTNPYAGPVTSPVNVVDPAGNIIPVGAGEKIVGSPDGRFVQVEGPDGKTGTRIDGGGHRGPAHTDPRAQGPHGHRPGVTNPDGTPWLPIRVAPNITPIN